MSTQGIRSFIDIPALLLLVGYLGVSIYYFQLAGAEFKEGKQYLLIGAIYFSINMLMHFFKKDYRKISWLYFVLGVILSFFVITKLNNNLHEKQLSLPDTEQVMLKIKATQNRQ